jgi:hypothetical protein
VNESYLYLGTIAKTGSWAEIDCSTLTKETVNKVFYGLLTKKSNLIGIAAQHQKLDKFPKNLLNQEGLSSANQDGETALHFICSNNQLKFIPKEFLNEENLLQPNNFGTTPMHILCHLGYLDQLPRNLITDKLLCGSNNNKHSCLDFNLFALEDNSVTANPERNREHLKAQMELIVSRLNQESLKKELEIGTTSACYQKKVKLVKRVLAQKIILESLTKENSSLEI